MKTIRIALVSLSAAFGSLVSFAQQTQAEAFVSSITGSATVLAPGATEAVPVVIGQKLPEGSTVKTGEGTAVLIQSHQGIQTGVGAKSSVVVGAHTVSSDGVRTAVIDLKEGTTVSVLDPAKRSVNNYAVRTPKGVAAARGTIYTTTVTLSSGREAVVTVNTVTGSVSFAIAGGQTISVAAGNSASSGSTAATPVAQAFTNSSAQGKAEIVEAVKLSAFVTAVLAENVDFPGLGNAVNGFVNTAFSGNPGLFGAVLQGAIAGAQAGQGVEVTTSPDGITTITAPSPRATPTNPTTDITIREEVQSVSS
jgi:FecR protein